MDCHQPAPDPKEQYYHTVHNFPVDMSLVYQFTGTSAEYLQHPAELSQRSQAPTRPDARHGV